MRTRMARRLVGPALIALVCGVTRVAGGQTLYIDDANNQLGTINVATGATTLIGTLGGDQITDLAFSPSGVLYGLSFDNLYSIDRTTGATTFIGAHGIAGGNALVFGTNGTLYGAGSSSTSLFSLSTTTGAATSLGSLGFESAGDLAFNGGDLFLSSSTGQLIRINLAGTVSGTAVGNFGFNDVFGMATAQNGILYGISGTQIFSVNTMSGAGTLLRDYGGSQLGAANGTTFMSEALPPGPPSTVPEPTTVALLGTGLVGLIPIVRRRRR